VKIRVDIVQSDHSLAEPRTTIDRSNVIQEALWQQTKAPVARDNGMVPAGLFIQTLNEMNDDEERRLAALRNRVPNVVLMWLFGIAAIAGGFAGYASSLDPKRNRLPELMSWRWPGSTSMIRKRWYHGSCGTQPALPWCRIL
jgi:hypothetical protein